MARGEGGGGGQREGNALKTAVVVTGGLVLAWFTMEFAFKPFLDRLRGALSRSTDPAPRDPDEEPPAAPPADRGAQESAAAAEPSAPLEGGEKKGEDKEVELEEKGEGASEAE